MHTYKCISMCEYSCVVYMYATWWSVGAVDLLNPAQLYSNRTSASHICPWYQHQWHCHLPLVGSHICIALNVICSIERWVTLPPMAISCHWCGQRQALWLPILLKMSNTKITMWPWVLSPVMTTLWHICTDIYIHIYRCQGVCESSLGNGESSC